MTYIARLVLIGATAWFGGVDGLDPSQSREPIAVVVHPSNPADALTMEDLRRLYLGGITLFDHRERVELLESSNERVRFYRAALGMGEDRLKRHWVSRVFAGDPGSPPEEFRDAQDLVRYVATHPGAIAFVPSNLVDGSVKVVRIEGLRPTEAAYPIY